MTQYVDWKFAKTAGARLVPPGPDVSHDEAAETVAEIRELAAAAVAPVAATSRLTAPGDAPAPLVVDRPTWIEVNADSMAALLDPAMQAMASRKSKEPWGPAQAIGSKLTGAEAGGMLAFLSTKVLGQYDIAPDGTPALLLVAPNIVTTERDLSVVPRDFRFWVCLHEETHRVQFTAVPWLRGHIIDSARNLAGDLMPDAESLKSRLEQMATQVPRVLSGDGQGLAELVITPEQRERMAEVTAVMSLLEGHADVVMDDVGPDHVPTVATIRERFTTRRKGAGAADRLLRRLLGLEAKMRQYRDGAVFVREVQDTVGVDGFNAVWTSPETLPTALEITEPAAWVRRVHG
ncbi:coenzyme F420 biosynthesis protein [Janibacter sp. Soil728]|uniref:zinc-dependent metalloprotease n=1 Tax=Janibacter sp. Soil728 TaxID=1736393 RepID=UPI0006F4311C|nr:zinc-dependent metalloprotease [Janibacter sp. Soil728]KRE37402.1 coenzyme F420 biosynthesis protein [Janibacter sp. Soil728]